MWPAIFREEKNRAHAQLLTQTNWSGVKGLTCRDRDKRHLSSHLDDTLHDEPLPWHFRHSLTHDSMKKRTAMICSLVVRGKPCGERTRGKEGKKKRSMR